MDNYSKGPNVAAAEVTLASLAISGLSSSSEAVLTTLKANTRLRGAADAVDRNLREKGCVVIVGAGPALAKTISCAEIVKRRHPGAFQYNRLDYETSLELWEPREEAFDRLQVVRDVPRVVIVLSSVALADSDVSAQPASLAHFLAMPAESHGSKARGVGNGGINSSSNNPLSSGNKRRKVRKQNKENVGAKAAEKKEGQRLLRQAISLGETKHRP